MILVTVGAQMPFDRLVRTVDAWAANHKNAPVFAQIGPGAWLPPHLAWTEFLAPAEFRRRAAQAEAIVSHAGMGTILTALELGKPILVMPRRGDLRETRNDHQIATARQFLARGDIGVAFDEEELLARLDHIDELPHPAGISGMASAALITCLRNFIARPPSAHRRAGSLAWRLKPRTAGRVQ